MSAREGLELQTTVVSDSAPLNGLVSLMLEGGGAIRCMRDPTRGGVATVVNELANSAGVEILIEETAVPVRDGVHAACEILGLDPLYVACEADWLRSPIAELRTKCLLRCAVIRSAATPAASASSREARRRECCYELRSERPACSTCSPGRNFRGSVKRILSTVELVELRNRCAMVSRDGRARSSAANQTSFPPLPARSPRAKLIDPSQTLALFILSKDVGRHLPEYGTVRPWFAVTRCWSGVDSNRPCREKFLRRKTSAIA